MAAGSRERISDVLVDLQSQRDDLATSSADPPLLRATRLAIAYWHRRLSAADRRGRSHPRGGAGPAVRR